MKGSANHQQRFLITTLILIGPLIGYSLQQTLFSYRNENSNVSKSTNNLEGKTQTIHNEQAASCSAPSATPNQEQPESFSEREWSQSTLSSSMLKSYIRMNSVRPYQLDLHSYRPEVEFGGDPIFVDSSSETDKQTCFKHLTVYSDLLKQFQDTDPVSGLTSTSALQLADTFGRPEAGALNGNQFWLGRYEQCLDYSHKTSINGTETRIKSQYCLGVVQFPNWNPSEGKTSLKVGLCLPETCTSSMLNTESSLKAQVQSMMMNQIHPNGPYARLQIRSVYCLPHETSRLRQMTFSAKAFIALIGCFVGCAVFATILDYDTTSKVAISSSNQSMGQLEYQQQQLEKDPNEFSSSWKRIVIESFSITRNIQKFLHVRGESVSTNASKAQIRSPSEISTISTNEKSIVSGEYNTTDGALIPDVDYTPFDESVFFNSMAGIKCIGLVWITAGHSFMISPTFTTSTVNLDSLTQTYLADIYLAAHMMVDTFFVLMGMIASYMIFKNGIASIKTKHWIMIVVHRYWRLTPIYLLCYWFTKSLGALVNSGPLWDYATSELSPRVYCARESWLVALLHLSDFKSPKDHCVPSAWFIANGIKFCMVTPLLLVPLGKSIKRGYTILLLALAANIGLVYWLSSQAEVDVKALIDFKPEVADNMLNNMGQIYTGPHSRIGAYLIGLLAGHLFYLERSGSLRIKLGRESARIGWTLFSITCLGLVFLLKTLRYLKLNDDMMKNSFSAGSALVRPIWSLCSWWLVFALAHGQAPSLARFLSAKFWLICVKLTFCAYLTQGEVIAQLYLSLPFAITKFQYMDLLSSALFALVSTMVLSFLIVIFIEYPLNGIERLILPSKLNEAKHKTADKQQPPSIGNFQQIALERKVK